MNAHLPAQNEARDADTRPLLVSFSGIDGAGKTTQIENAIAAFQSTGLTVRVIRFWDDIASFRRLRESLGHAIFRGEKGVGAPDKPVRRRDKDVRTWYMLPVRMALCLFDSISLARAVEQLRNQPDVDVVILDRYVYDQFANLEVRNPFVRSYLRRLLRWIPKPDAAFLLDADPETASARKPEYPLEFLRENRACYLQLSALAGLTVIRPGTPQEVENAIFQQLRELPWPRSLERRTSSPGTLSTV